MTMQLLVDGKVVAEGIDIIETKEGFVIRRPGGHTAPVPSLETIISRLPSFFRQHMKGKKNTQCMYKCPHCNSADSIGHGRRMAKNGLRTRRFCNSCGRTFNVEESGDWYEKL